MLEVWGRRISGNVIPVMWTIGALGLEYTRHLVGGCFGGLDTDEYRALNPNGRIPTIRDDGITHTGTTTCPSSGRHARGWRPGTSGCARDRPIESTS